MVGRLIGGVFCIILLEYLVSESMVGDWKGWGVNSVVVIVVGWLVCYQRG